MSRYQVIDCYVNSQFRWFGSLIAFASQLIFVLHDNLIPSHDCLNPTRINRKCAKRQRQVTVYARDRTCLRSMVLCGSIMHSFPVLLSIIKLIAKAMSKKHLDLCLSAYLFYLCSRNIYRTRSAADDIDYAQLVWANNCIGNYHVISLPTVVNIREYRK